MHRKSLVALVLALASATSIGCKHKTNADGGDTGDMDSGTSGGWYDSSMDSTVDGGGFPPGDDANVDADTGGGSGSDDSGLGGIDSNVDADTGMGGGGTDTGTGVRMDTGTGLDTDGGTGGTLTLGNSCTSDAQCGSGRCLAIALGGGPVCVTPCTTHSDCSATTYCAPDPSAPTSGVCVLRAESTLCTPCTSSSDCGVLNQVCTMGPGDTQNACHTDCSLDPAGCPSGYSCTFVGTRRICAPTGTTCAAATGCSGTSSCAANQMCCSGTCTPVDTFSSCGSCGTHCSTGEGCCGAVCRTLNTVMNCGACGNVCLGGGTTGDATCGTTMGVTSCRLTCRGENWDSNGDPADGCETTDSVPPGHTAGAATSRGSFNACDAMSRDSFSGHIVSDARIHLPAVSGLDLAVGASPDFWTVVATGAPPIDTGVACTNDFSATITTTGGSASGTCYRLTVTGGSATYTADVSGSGSATITHAAPAYSSGATLTFEIQKTCSSATHEDVTYTVSYHL